MNALEWFMRLHKGLPEYPMSGFFSTERPCKIASNSEIRRWFEKGSILINGKKANIYDEITNIYSCVVHPKSKSKITIF
jgi:hypothetical protein